MRHLGKALLVAVLAASCGSQSSDKSSNTPTVTKDDSAGQTVELPKQTIIRVPVDTNGNELNDQADIRLVQSETEISGDQVAAATYNRSEAPARLVDELDEDSSTESWGWRWGRSGHYGNYWGNNWQSYRPTYYGYNQYYYWNYNSCYNYYGYNYYVYNQGWY